MGDVKVEALANTLLHSLAVVQAKKPGDTMRNMEAEVLVDRVAEVKVIKVGQLLNDLKAASLVVTLAPLWRKWRPSDLVKHYVMLRPRWST